MAEKVYVVVGMQAVAAEMGNRTAQQVHHYYRDNMLALKKGPWSPDEDAALLKVCRPLYFDFTCTTCKHSMVLSSVSFKSGPELIC